MLTAVVLIMVTGLAACSGRQPGFAPPTMTVSPTAPPTPTSPATGFPTINQVGWQPSGVTLKTYTGPTTITTSGTVIDGADIRSGIVVRANNVTIKRSRITADGYYLVQQESGYSGLTLDQVEVTSAAGAMGDRAIASWGTGLTVTRSYVHNTQRGIAVGDGSVITDNYIDDLYNDTENHATAIASWGNVQNVTLRHNTLGCGTGMCSSAMSVYPMQGPNDNWTIDNNLFNGGSYCVYLGYTPADGEKPNTNMKVTNNSFGTKYNANCGTYGPVGSWSGGGGNVWRANTWYTPGQARDGQPVEVSSD